MDLLSVEKLIATSRYYFSIPLSGESQIERPASKPRKNKSMRRRRAQLAHSLHQDRRISL